MRKINTLLAICAAASMLHAQPRINPDDYKIDAALWAPQSKGGRRDR